MAGEEAAEGSRRRRHMGLNLYVELPPLPRSQVRIDTSVASSILMMPNSSGAAPEAPRTGEPKESLAPAAVAGEPEKDGSCNCNSSFECNICLDVAIQPVVTACGHLFCWPCLYRWLYQQAPFPECPVCKGEVLAGNIIPIYGRGSEEGDSSTASPGLPPRPRANRRESARHHMQRAGHNVTQLESMIMQAIQNQQGRVGGLPTPAPAGAGMPSGNAARVVPAAPLQSSSSVEQLPTSSTATAIAGEPGPSRRSRRTIRRPRRPQ